MRATYQELRHAEAWVLHLEWAREFDARMRQGTANGIRAGQRVGRRYAGPRRRVELRSGGELGATSQPGVSSLPRRKASPIRALVPKGTDQGRNVNTTLIRRERRSSFATDSRFAITLQLSIRNAGF